jgi:hypothetical protein
MPEANRPSGSAQGLATNLACSRDVRLSARHPGDGVRGASGFQTEGENHYVLISRSRRQPTLKEPQRVVTTMATRS